jgi:hypothetical protein
MNKWLAVLIMMISTGGLLIATSMALQVAPTADSFKAHEQAASGYVWKEISYATSSYVFTTTRAGNVTGLSLYLKLPGTHSGGSSGSYMFSWVVSCDLDKDGLQEAIVGVGQSSVGLTETWTWFSLPASGGSYIPGSTACSSYVKRISGASYVPRWAYDGASGRSAQVLWETAYTPPAGAPPPSLPPSTPPGTTPSPPGGTTPPPLGEDRTLPEEIVYIGVGLAIVGVLVVVFFRPG